ncbi:MAG: penicillin-binding transpeptidase domain-containing protein [Hominenteromicrobium sp.]
MAGSNNSNIWVRTVRITIALVVLGFGFVIFNLVRWQLVRGEELKAKAIDQSLTSTELTPTRGTIYDVTGTKVLAQSASVWTVALEPNYIDTEKGDDVKIAKGLSEILGMDYEAVLKKAQQNSYFTYVKRKVETDVRDQILEMIDEQKIGRGIILMEDYKRYYPYGSTASTVLGFTGTDNQGLAGIETQYDDVLSGTEGRLVSAKNAIGTDMPFQYDQYIEASDGYDLVLTIDETVQSIVEKHLETGLEACGALEGGTAIVMDVNTGAILALATKGDYDPNNPFVISEEAEAAIPEKVEEQIEEALEKEQQELNKLQLDIDTAKTDEEREAAEQALEEYDRLTSEDIAELRETLENEAYAAAQNKQWRNKAVSDTYYPGSVFKMITGSMALEEGLVTEESTYTCTGEWTFNDSSLDPISCWYHAGHGTETLVDGICNSCNPYMIWLGQKLGRQTFFDYFDAFGFTTRTGIDLPGEADSIYYDVDGLNVVELATESFGQNFSITPIQMITAICAVANGGYLVQPHVVDRMLDSEGNIVQTTDTSYKRQVISEDVSARMTKILQRNATSESGKNGYVAGYRIAGKTGTSEKVALYWQEKTEGKDRGMQYIVSYGGYAPADDPQYALLVFYDEPQIGNPSGGSQAGPIFAAIMEEILPYLGVDPQYTESEYENLAGTTPNVIGRTIGEAKQQLEEAGFDWTVVDYSGEDTDDQLVVTQVPSPGASIPKEGMVALYTEEPNEEDYVEVPSFVGYSVETCQYLASVADVQVLVTGSSSSGYAQSQDTAAGTRVKRGSVIKISFVSSGGVESVTDDNP